MFIILVDELIVWKNFLVPCTIQNETTKEHNTICRKKNGLFSVEEIILFNKLKLYSW